MEPLRWRPPPSLSFSTPQALSTSVAKLVGTELGREVARLLTGALPTLANQDNAATAPLALPSAVQQFASKLQQLGITSREPGDVLRQLRQQLPERGLTEENVAALPLDPGGLTDDPTTLTAAERDYVASLDPGMRASFAYQKMVSRMTEAFTLLSNMIKATDQATNGYLQNLK